MSRTAAPVWVVASPSTVDRWGRALEASGIESVPLPWSEVRAAADADAAADRIRSDSFDLVFFTSAHALAFLPTSIGVGRRCACVGERTAAAARALGFEVLHIGSRGAGSLAASLCREPQGPGRVLLVRGRESHDEASSVFRAQGVAFAEVIAYAVDEAPAFSALVAEASGVGVAAPIVVVGSPRALSAFERARGGAVALGRFVVPGATTGAAAERLSPGRVHVAAQPEPESLVEAVRAALAEERNASS